MNTSNVQNSLCRPHSARSPVFGSFMTMEFEVQLASPATTAAKRKYRFSFGERIIGDAFSAIFTLNTASGQLTSSSSILGLPERSMALHEVQ